MARRRKKRFRWLKFILEVLILATMAVGLFVAAKLVKIDRGKIAKDNIVKNESIPSDELESMSGYTNLVLFGVDSRKGQLESGTNSDTIMICSINDSTKEIKLVSVYRDTYLDTTGGEYRKCTEVYAIGGAQQAISMLNKNLDLNITDYVTVNFEAMVEIVDMFGGVDITLSEGEVELLNGYLVEEREVLGKECEDVSGPGRQHLNGMQALAYSRNRYIGLDYERTERQRAVLEQVFAKAQASDIITLNKAVDTILPMISTSLSSLEILRLVSDAGSFWMEETQGFPVDKTTALVSGADCVIAVDLASNVSKLHSFLFGTENYVPSQTVQEISDTIVQQTGISGMGAE